MDFFLLLYLCVEKNITHFELFRKSPQRERKLFSCIHDFQVLLLRETILRLRFQLKFTGRQFQNVYHNLAANKVPMG